MVTLPSWRFTVSLPSITASGVGVMLAFWIAPVSEPMGKVRVCVPMAV